MSQEKLGEVRFVWDQDPRVADQLARAITFRMRQNYVQVFGQPNLVWVEHRRRVPSFNGAKRSDASAYSIGTTVYDAPTGDFWTAILEVAAGESPTTNPEKWERLEVPYVFAEYLAQSIYASLTNKDQQTPEDFSVQLTAGYPLLLAELDKIERQQGQTRQLRVRR